MMTWVRIISSGGEPGERIPGLSSFAEKAPGKGGLDLEPAGG